MIIKKIAIGNSTEGFIESSFSDDFNIILSEDNNKGKTIVIQGILYTLGNEPPAFPSSFEYKKYFYILQFVDSEKEYWICRRDNEFVIFNNGTIFLAENVSEFKRYWDKNIFPLPRIVVNNMSRIVDPVLLLQLFSVGQDQKSTDNIENKGFYKKKDFYNLIYEISGIGSIKLNKEEISILKNKLNNLKDERTNLLTQNKFLKSKKRSSEILSTIVDRDNFEEKIKEMEKIKGEILELKKERNKCINKKLNWENTIKELKSLNRIIKTGELRCMDCNSTNILYKGTKKDSFSFDVSTKEMRDSILNSIKEKIDSCEEEKERYSIEIQKKQELLKDIMVEDDISLEMLVAYKKQFVDSSEIEQKILDINKQIVELEGSIKNTEINTEGKKEKQNILIKTIVQNMNDFYKAVDSSGNNEINDIFSKSGRIYSGSDATMFYLARLYSLTKVLNLTFPIIVDSFRAEDLSTDKEAVVLDWFSKLQNQLIFTTTLKKQEKGKYDKDNRINVIDYTQHMSSKLLQNQYSLEVKDLLSNIFKIDI